MYYTMDESDCLMPVQATHRVLVEPLSIRAFFRLPSSHQAVQSLMVVGPLVYSASAATSLHLQIEVVLMASLNNAVFDSLLIGRLGGPSGSFPACTTTADYQ